MTHMGFTMTPNLDAVDELARKQMRLLGVKPRKANTNPLYLTKEDIRIMNEILSGNYQNKK